MFNWQDFINDFPYTNFSDINVSWFLNKFKQVFDEWQGLYTSLQEWKNATDAYNEQWRQQQEQAFQNWENNFQTAIDEWKLQTETDIGTWENNTLTNLETWKNAFITQYNALKAEVEQIADDAESAKNAAQLSAQNAEQSAQTAEDIAQSLNTSLTQIGTNTVDISSLKQQLNNDKTAPSGYVMTASNNGHGTEWTLAGTPTDSQAQTAIENWLNNHPEATTTVTDHSLGFEKLINGTLGFVTPEMFGAIGDGIADDTLAIQNSIDSGFPVYFDKKYLVNGRIDINRNCMLIGNINGFVKQNANDTNLFSINNAEFVYIESMHLIGKGSDFTQSSGKIVPYGIIITGNSLNLPMFINVDKCYIEKFSHCNIGVFDVDNTIISNNKIVGTGTDGTFTVNTNYQFGISVKNSKNVHIIENDISYTVHAIYINRDNVDLVIDSNNIHNIPAQHGIYIIDSNGTSITNNMFRDINDAAIKLQLDTATTKDATGYIVKGNILNNVNQQAIMITKAGDPVNYYTVDALICNNFMYNCHTGILNGHAKNTTIENNIYYNGEIGIALGEITENTIIKNNRIENASTTGLYGRTNSKINGIDIENNRFVNARITFTGATTITDVVFINNEYGTVAGFPDKTIYGRFKDKNIKIDSAGSLQGYTNKDVVLFPFNSGNEFNGGYINEFGAEVFFGKYYTNYPFTVISTLTKWTVNNMNAYSENNHEIIIKMDITCNSRASYTPVGTFTGFDTTDWNWGTETYKPLIETGDGYPINVRLYKNAGTIGTISMGSGVVGTTYKYTITLTDGEVTSVVAE